jgi:NAD+ kinase
MIQVDVQHSGGTNGKQESAGYHALNDVVLGRGAVARVIRVQVSIDGAYLTSYRSDAILIFTATGSTGYNLSAGGPILEPQASEMVLKPVAPHVGIATALVLPRSAMVELQIESEDPAIFSVDGFLDLRLKKGDTVKVKQSSLTSLFLRERTPQDFYASLTRRLGFESNDGIGRSVSY